MIVADFAHDRGVGPSTLRLRCHEPLKILYSHDVNRDPQKWSADSVDELVDLRAQGKIILAKKSADHVVDLGWEAQQW